MCGNEQDYAGFCGMMCSWGEIRNLFEMQRIMRGYMKRIFIEPEQGFSVFAGGGFQNWKKCCQVSIVIEACSQNTLTGGMPPVWLEKRNASKHSLLTL